MYLLIIVTTIAVFGALTTIGASAVTFGTAPYEYNGEKGVAIIDFGDVNLGETVIIPAEIDGKPVLSLGLPGAISHIPGAEKIEALDLSESGVNVIEQYAFYNCSKLNGQYISTNTGQIQALINYSVETIGNRAFYNCTGFNSMTFDALKMIGDAAFYDCTNLSIFRASELEMIGNSAFHNCKNLKIIDSTNIKVIGCAAFQYCSNICKFDQPKLEAVGSYAFNGCTKLAYVSSESLKTVGDLAFCGCKNLEYIVLIKDCDIGAMIFFECPIPSIFYIDEVPKFESA